MDINKEKTQLDLIKTALSFLTTDFGFQLIKTEVKENFMAKHFFIYRNDKSRLQLEICGDDSWFHCEIRRILNGQPAKYTDKDNCIGFESLAIYESNNTYNHLDYSVFGDKGLKRVLSNTVKLFKRNREFFTSDKWIDIKKINQLRDDAIEKTVGWRPDHNKPSFFHELRNKVSNVFINNGYSLFVDSDELPPFDYDSMVHFVTFQKENNQIKITQADWRDDYYRYCIELNNKKVFEIDLRNQETQIVIDTIIEEIRKYIN